MTLDEMIREWEINGEVPESRELVRMEKIIRTAIKERASLTAQLAAANAEIERLRKIEAAAKFAREQWGKRDCFLLPLENQALTQLDEALAGEGGG